MHEHESFQRSQDGEVAVALVRLRRALRRTETVMLPPQEDAGDYPGEEWDSVQEAVDAVDEAVNALLRAYVAAQRAAETKLGGYIE
jgi:hypothetical protein